MRCERKRQPSEARPAVHFASGTNDMRNRFREAGKSLPEPSSEALGTFELELASRTLLDRCDLPCR